MRSLSLATLVALSIFSTNGPATAVAHDRSLAPVTPQDLEIGRLKLRLFERVDYPLRLREINNEIRTLETTIKMLKAQIREYERFPRSPFFVTLQNTRLRLQKAEQDLKLARQERALLQAHGPEEIQLRKLLIERAERQIR